MCWELRAMSFEWLRYRFADYTSFADNKSTRQRVAAALCFADGIAVVWPLSVVCCPLSVVRCPLSVVCCPLSVVRCPLSVVCCPLSVVCCLLSRKAKRNSHGFDPKLPYFYPLNYIVLTRKCHTFQTRKKREKIWLFRKKVVPLQNFPRGREWCCRTI